MRTRFPLCFAVITGVTPVTASACEPIIPLTQLMSGATLAGPVLLTRSLAWLGVAVAIKCAAFVLFERRLPWPKAVLFMALGNVVSTIPGLLTAVFAGALTLVAIPIVFAFGVFAQRRISSLSAQGYPHGFTGRGVAFTLTAAFIGSVVMFSLATGALDTSKFAHYWIFKFLFTTLAVSVGMGISAVLEESAIARFARDAHGQLSFYTSVLRANYLTLGVVLLVAAWQMLPKRWHAPHFIVGSFQAMVSLLANLTGG